MAQHTSSIPRTLRTGFLQLFLLLGIIALPSFAFAVETAGTLDASFDPGVGANGSVNAVVQQADGKVIIGGVFTAVDGVSRNKIARLNSDGSLDVSFDPGMGASDYVSAIAIQSDGRVLIGGNFLTVNGVVRNKLARLNGDGSLDASFNSGTWDMYHSVSAVVVQPDGKILISGRFSTINGVTRYSIARLNSNGDVDATFNRGSGVSTVYSISTMALQPDGKVLIGGDFAVIDDLSRKNIARLNSNGTLDSSFGSSVGAYNQVYAIALQSDGKVLIGGYFTSVNNVARNKLARLNSNGMVDVSFDPGTGDAAVNVYAMALQPDGKVLVGGDFTSMNGAARSKLARLNVNGTVDTSFNPGTGVDNTVKTVVLQSDGKVLFGGVFSSVNGAVRNYVARIHTGDADADSIQDGADRFPLNFAESLDTDNDSVGNNADTDDDNDTLLDGSDNCPLNSNLDQRNSDGDAQGDVCDTDDDNDGVADASDGFPLNTAASTDADADAFPTNWNVSCNASCQVTSGLMLDNCPVNANVDQQDADGDAAGNACDTDDDNDGVLDVSDNCPLNSNANQLDSDNDTEGDVCDASPFVAVPGTLDASFDTGVGANNTVFEVALQPNGKLIVAGNFSTVNSVSRNKIAQLNNNGSLDAGFDPGTGVNSGVCYTAATQPDGQVLIGGYFSSVNGVSRNGLARLNGNGSLDTSFNSGTLTSNTQPQVQAIAIQPDGKVIIGGGFDSVNGIQRLGMARLNKNGRLDASFNSNSSALTIQLQPDGKVIIGGGFTGQFYGPPNRIDRLNNDGSRGADFNYSGANDVVYAAALQVDGKIVIGGSFTTVNGVTRNRIARINSDGSLDTSFNPGTGADNRVYAMALQADGKIIIGGTFTAVNGVTRNRIARINSDGSLDTSFDPGTGANNTVESVALQGDGKVVFGGDFTTVNGVVRNRIARLNTGDTDGDGTQDGTDALPLDAAESHDTDHDGIGNNADTDDDNDTLLDGNDNCPLNQNVDQWNSDGDSLGDACDIDNDNDGVSDTSDGFPLNVVASSDDDADGIPNSWNAACDITCQSNSGLVLDNCPTFTSPDQLDTDADGQGNVCDTDDDNDGLVDTGDAFPLDNTQAGDIDADSVDGFIDNCPSTANADQLDTDGDTQGNACDTDDDNDGVADTYDKFPLNAAASVDDDVDGVPTSWNAACVATCQSNSGLVLDNCPSNANADQLNTDGDTQGNVCDTDDDNDGFLDAADNCPLISNVTQTDSDSDSQGDVCDATPLAAHAGSLDSSFNIGSGFGGAGYNGGVSTLAVQADGKMIAGGSFTSMNGTTRNYIARLNTDGSVDSSFNTGSGANHYVYASAVQADGKIVIGGHFTLINNVWRSNIARLNANGSLDTSFNPGSGMNYAVWALAVQADGKIVVGGDFTTVNGAGRLNIARLNADGSLDSGFNPGSGANNYIYSLALQPDGKILIGGIFGTVNGVARNGIARLNTNGSLDTSFNPVANTTRSIVLQADGKIVIGGQFNTVNGTPRNGIARLNADGSLDTSFNPGTGARYGSGSFSATVSTTGLQADGKIIVGGNFTTMNGVVCNGIARLNTDGSLDTSFNPGTGVLDVLYGVSAVVIQPNGKIVMGGPFYSVNGWSQNKIARLHSGDADSDGIEDAADNDSDNDGVVNSQDSFPFNAAESLDTDLDGIGNNADLDDDNDGVPDYIDADSLNATIHSERTLLLNNSYKGSVVRDAVQVQ